MFVYEERREVCEEKKGLLMGSSKGKKGCEQEVYKKGVVKGRHRMEDGEEWKKEILEEEKKQGKERRK